MITSDKEAREFWCPMVRIGDVTTFNKITNHIDDMNDIFKCVSTDCMMWRFASKDNNDMSGFCGLAGRPIELDITGDKK